ncbi:MAG: c-type cytochrome [Trueperaceae bacterium]
MLTSVIIILLALALFGYVALPLLNPRGADPLPPERDPVTSDLEEEKAALFRAIQELDSREDLPPERRAQLRARYEAKAARVLRTLDERPDERAVPAAANPRRRTRIPYGALTLLAGTLVIATTLGSYVLPRIGENATLTSFFREDLDQARALRDAQRAAENDPSADNLLAVADAYWRADDAENALTYYERAVEEAGARSALALRRLGFLNLQSDLGDALAYLERSRQIEPDDLDTLFAIGEINFARGDLDAAREAWRAYLEAPDGSNDPAVLARLELATEMHPVLERVEADPSRDNLLALADVLWRFDERERAVEVYFRVLTQLDPNDPVALGRTGQLLFLSGRNEDAIALMERAAESRQVGTQTLLFLGNAYFSAERYQEAIDVWERHIALVGKDEAGRVPGLVADARSRLNGQAGAPIATTGQVSSGDSIFASNCAGCHGEGGSGGSGPRLAGNPRASEPENVRNAVRFGRGMMPGFAAVLSEAEIDSVVAFVTEVLNASGTVR